MMPEEKSFEVWNDYGVENFDEMVNLFAAFLDDTESEQAEQLENGRKSISNRLIFQLHMMMILILHMIFIMLCLQKVSHLRNAL